MKIKSIICSTVALGLLAVGFTACETGRGERDGEQAAKLEAQAKISKAEAEKIALEKVPGGTVKEGELEKEKGKLIWSFDIANPGTTDITEVQVDALSGAVLDISKESVAEQANEKKEEMKGKKEEHEEEEKEEK